MNIFWFRRDLRLDDNAALYRALQAGSVLPVFIFDTDILDQLEDRDDRRVSFIHQELLRIKQRLEQAGSTLLVLHGKPLDMMASLLSRYPVENVFAGKDYEPYALERDREVAELLQSKGAQLVLIKNHVIFEQDEILKADHTPYIIYTPYMRAWKRKYPLEAPVSCASEDCLDQLLAHKPVVMPTLEQLGFLPFAHPVPDPILEPDRIRLYDQQRDFPALEATSLIGPHLRFGTLSIRQLVEMAMDLNPVWLNQLIWREFFIQILFHFPHSATASFRKDYDRIPWRNNRAEFKRWCAGKTGYPIVDAGMRQLNETGFMHNRVRMITANFLTKLLLIDWRWGEQYFARKLLDYEMANNIGGWQWSSGSGCDAAPYFRIFNPDTQIEKFDPELKYIRRWVPEFGTPAYPLPMVDYRQARERAMLVYKSALQSRPPA